MDAIMMFKILVLQSLYNLGDDAAEYLIRNRLSFMRFLGLGLADKGPDAKTLWLYREHWTQVGVVEDLLERFNQVLRDEGFLAMSGKLVRTVGIPSARTKIGMMSPVYNMCRLVWLARDEVPARA